MKLMLSSHHANFYVLDRINQVDHKKKEKGRMPATAEEKKRTKKRKKRKKRTRRMALTVYSNP